jgi:hypothetical protein
MKNAHTQLQMMRRRIFPDSGISSAGLLAGLGGAAGFAPGLGGVATALAPAAFAEVVEGAPSAFAMLKLLQLQLAERFIFQKALKIQYK